MGVIVAVHIAMRCFTHYTEIC